MLLLVFLAFKSVRSEMRTCASLIVRNEERVIERFLENNRYAFDHFDFTDTGSSDKTVEKIRAYLIAHNISGRVHFYMWADDFGRARTYALERSRETPCAHYVFLDADDEVWLASQRRLLRADDREAFINYMKSHCHGVCSTQTLVANGFMWWRLFAISGNTQGTFKGARHETIDAPSGTPASNLDEYIVFAHRDQTRLNREPNALIVDGLALERDVMRGENAVRAMYYAGQSYEQGGDLERALSLYRKRVATTEGWLQERYVAQLHIGKILEKQSNFVTASAEYFKAIEIDSTRAESYYYLARGFRFSRNYVVCFLLAREGARQKSLSSHLFAEKEVSDFLIIDEAATCGSYLPDYRIESLEFFFALRKKRPDDKRILDNLLWMNRTLADAFAANALGGSSKNRARLLRLWKSNRQ